MMRRLLPIWILVSLLAAREARAQSAPYPPSSTITGIELDWSTHRRAAQGSDNFQLTWGADGHQYGFWGDGGGFGGTNSDGRVGLGFARIEGSGTGWKGYNVWGGKNPENSAQFDGKSWGTISVDGVFYSWITPDNPDTGGGRDHYKYIELARSTNKGATWSKASWRWRIGDNLIIPTFLNFGRDNAGARDGYVYSYFIRPQNTSVTQSSHGLEVHKPGALFLARVPKGQIWNGRSAYEWFTGMSGGNPTWGSLGAKKPVFQDPNGTGWCLSASYNAGLKRYLLGLEHTASHSSIMGLFDAPEPWGPWTTVKYWTSGDRFGESRPGSTLAWKFNVFYIAFGPKWVSADGKSFTLNFTGGGGGKDNDSFNTIQGRFTVSSAGGGGGGGTGGGGGGGAGSGLVSNTAPNSYTWENMSVGSSQYVDRSYTFTALPSGLSGEPFLQTANDDKSSAGSSWITFDVSADAAVYVAHDDRITAKPSWLAGFVDTGNDLVSAAGTFSLWAKNVPPGAVSLGGNIEGGSTGNSMYTVVVGPPQASLPSGGTGGGSATGGGQQPGGASSRGEGSNGCGATGAEAAILFFGLALARRRFRGGAIADSAVPRET